MHQGNNLEKVKSCFSIIYLRKQLFRGQEERHGVTKNRRHVCLTSVEGRSLNSLKIQKKSR